MNCASFQLSSRTERMDFLFVRVFEHLFEYVRFACICAIHIIKFNPEAEISMRAGSKVTEKHLQLRSDEAYLQSIRKASKRLFTIKENSICKAHRQNNTRSLTIYYWFFCFLILIENGWSDRILVSLPPSWLFYRGQNNVQELRTVIGNLVPNILPCC